jgi:hypothetical protein
MFLCVEHSAINRSFPSLSLPPPRPYLPVKIAAVLGREFDVALLASVMSDDRTPEEVRREVTELIKLGIMVWTQARALIHPT